MQRHPCLGPISISVAAAAGQRKSKKWKGSIKVPQGGGQHMRLERWLKQQGRELYGSAVIGKAVWWAWRQPLPCCCCCC